MAAVGEAVHLVRRFVGSVRPGAPSADDLAFVRTRLTHGEWDLFCSMSNPDQRHAVGVARAVLAELPGARREVVAAALLHDVGKVVSGLRTPGRVGATLFWAVTPDRLADGWLGAVRPLRTLAEYRRHPELGERLLVEAGAHAVTSRWAGDHHKPADRWRIDPAIGEVLKACDDD